MRIHQTGRALAEVAVAIMIIAVLIGIGLTAASRSAGEGRRTSAANEQMHAMHELIAAATAHVKENVQTFAEGVVVQIHIQTLVDTGKLPDNWQRRWASLGETPLGQVYQVRALKPSADPSSIRVVVTEGGTPRREVLSKLDLLETDPEAPLLRAHKAKVAKLLIERYNELSGVIIAPSSTVTFENGGNISLEQLLGPSTTATTVTVLAGFPELGDRIDTCVQGECGTTAFPTQRYGNCQVRTPSGATPASCPVDYEQVGSWPHCDVLHTERDHAYDTAAGTITVSETIEYQSAWSMCDDGALSFPSSPRRTSSMEVEPMCANYGHRNSRLLPQPASSESNIVCIFVGMVCGESFIGYQQAYPLDVPINGLVLTASAPGERTRILPINRESHARISLDATEIARYSCGRESWIRTGTGNVAVSNEMNYRPRPANAPVDVLCCQPL